MDFIGAVAMPSEDTSVIDFPVDIVLPSFTTPKFGAIVVHNRSGAALSTGGSTVEILSNQVNNT